MSRTNLCGRAVIKNTDQGCEKMRVISLQVKIHDNRTQMGETAAADVAAAMKALGEKQDTITMTFAAAPSQDDFLAALSAIPGVPWEKVVAFHLDEYLELPRGHANSFETYLNAHLFDAVKPGKVMLVADMTGTAQEKADAYEALLREHGGIDIACIGVGENGHIAFNEPGSDFHTPRWCDLITIDDKSVQQQFRDYKDHPNPEARYATLEDVPRNAITMTIPSICAAKQIFCIVPAQPKAEAIKAALEGPISNTCPASALRTHPDTIMYLDADAASLLTERIG
jgi:glucosamine-6-phosphate deaminase